MADYQYTDRELTTTNPNLSAIHDDAAIDSQISACCGISLWFHMRFIEDENESGVPQGQGTVTAHWSDDLCNDCKTAFDTIVDNRAPAI